MAELSTIRANIALFLIITACCLPREGSAAWDVLIAEKETVVAVNNIVQQNAIDKDHYSFSFLRSYDPNFIDKTKFIDDLLIGCGKPYAILLAHMEFDSNGNVIKDESYVNNDPPKQISIQTDVNLLLAVKYVCGDKSVKTPSAKEFIKRPKDVIALVCLVDDSKTSVTYFISESEKTINGNSATFGENFLYHKFEEGELKIDRYSGRFTFTTEGAILNGSCTKATKGF